MAKAISSMRIARSTIVTPATETDVIDFDLSPDQGLQLLALKSIWTSASLDDAITLRSQQAVASLHAEDDTLEDPSPEADATDRDTEVLHLDSILGHAVFSALGTGVGGTNVGSSPIEHFPEPIILAINPTHRVETTDWVSPGVAHMYLLYYRYVELSRIEQMDSILRGRG